MPLRKEGTTWMLDDIDTPQLGSLRVTNAQVVGYVSRLERGIRSLLKDNEQLRAENAKFKDELAQLKAKPAPKARQVLDTAGFDLRSFIIGVVALGALLLVVFNLGLIGRGIKNAASTSIGDVIGDITIGWVVAGVAVIWLILNWRRNRPAKPVSSNRQSLWQTMKENFDRNRGR